MSSYNTQYIYDLVDNITPSLKKIKAEVDAFSKSFTSQPITNLASQLDELRKSSLKSGTSYINKSIANLTKKSETAKESVSSLGESLNGFNQSLFNFKSGFEKNLELGKTLSEPLGNTLKDIKSFNKVTKSQIDLFEKADANKLTSFYQSLAKQIPILKELSSIQMTPVKGITSPKRIEGLNAMFQKHITVLKNVGKTADTVFSSFSNLVQRLSFDIKNLNRELFTTNAIASKNLKSINNIVNPKESTRTGRGRSRGGRTFPETMSNVLLYTSAYSLVGGTIGAAIAGTKAIADFDKEMAKLKANLIEFKPTMQDILKLEKEARNIGATTMFTAGESAAAMTELAKSGLNINEILSETRNAINLAISGELQLADATKILVNAQQQFGLKTSDFGMMSDVLVKGANLSTAAIDDFATSLQYLGSLPQISKMKFSEVISFLSTLAPVAKGSRAGTGLKDLLIELSKPTKESLSTLRKYGISAKDINIQDRGISAVLKSLKPLTSEEAVNSGDIFRVFGRIAAPTASFMIKNVAELDKMTESINNAKNAANQMSKEIENNLSGDFKQLTSSAAEFAIGSGIKDGLRAITQEITFLIRALSGADGEFNKLSATGKMLYSIYLPLLAIIKFTISLLSQSFKGLNIIFDTFIEKINKLASFLDKNKFRQGFMDMAIGPSPTQFNVAGATNQKGFSDTLVDIFGPQSAGFNLQTPSNIINNNQVNNNQMNRGGNQKLTVEFKNPPPNSKIGSTGDLGFNTEIYKR